MSELTSSDICLKVTQVKTTKRDGYESVQIGFDEKKSLNSPKIGHQKRSNTSYNILKEVTSSSVDSVEVGQSFDCSIFEVGEKVSIQGISKGKGFAGTVKRWNFKMQDATHGNSISHRAPGSIGQCQTPGKVWKGKKMSGHMGDEKKTIQNLKIASVDVENNLLLIKGAIPGPTGSNVILKPAVK